VEVAPTLHAPSLGQADDRSAGRCLVVHRGDARQQSRGMGATAQGPGGWPGRPLAQLLAACARCRAVLDCRRIPSDGVEEGRR
jgi:hypothetical protein